MAVDAQFYVALPIVAWLVYRMTPNRLQTQKVAIATLIAGAIIVSLLVRLYAIHAFPTGAYGPILKVTQRNLIGMGASFAVGSLVAYLGALRLRLPSPLPVITCTAGLALAGLELSIPFWHVSAPSPFNPIMMDDLGTLAVACILFGGQQLRSSAVNRFVDSRTVSTIAANAYALYLVHYVVLLGVFDLMLHFRIATAKHWFSVVLVLIFVVAAAILANLLQRFIEQPFLSMKERSRETAVEEPLPV